MNSSRILIVEDEAIVAADIEQRIQSLGYEVAGIVDTGEDALALAAAQSPDLALMDIRLKGRMSGIEAAAILRSHHQIPVVYLTSHADSDTLARAGSTEPFGYIVKPFQEHDLHAAIEMAFYRSQAENRLRKMERWLATTLDSINEGVLATDADGRITYLNRAAERILEWPRLEALGLAASAVFVVHHAETNAPIDDVVDDVLRHGTVRWLREHALLRTRGGASIPIDDSAAPIRDESGVTSGVVVVFRDRSEYEQHLEQRRRLEKKMQDAQRLESLGVLAGGIAHDFNNLLTGILGNASLALHLLPPPSPARECLDEVMLASRRAADLIKQLLAYSGRGRFLLERLDVSHLVEETANLLSLSIGKRATLEFTLDRALPAVEADASQLRQVVMNLVINASEAFGERTGRIRVFTGRMHAGREVLDSTLEGAALPEGEYICIRVEDDGQGISRENLGRIFDPFFTTKFTGRGLGLAAVLGIVRGHKGALAVESEEGRGTTFTILLPSVAGAPEASKVVRTDVPLWRGAGTVLLVDDEPTIRSTASMILRSSGFAVEAASDGREAIERFSQDPTRFALVLLDLTMPGMDGVEIFRRLRAINPSARVVLMSGYGEEEVTGRFSGHGLSGFVQKPFDSATLLEALRRVLAP